MSNVLKALVAENVGLIKSIASRHLDKVQMYVWQSISNGYDLAGLTKNLKHEYGVTQRRTARIASDQANKAHAGRRQELGIKKAIWLHSHAGENQDPHTLLHMEKPLMWLRACICMASGLNLGN
ncbi:hypothetical protein [Acinetobacter calcoaceticus]|uniref:hypothetical protein n=1 Tax=Acinetobacter calcoaceticus TaxID=471 RepID=UPI002274C082|nr:hypothetical protein [Acinetobacter calcoaceticus]GLG83312.1 hypothetical protein ACSO1_18340 [Acinetobacter calcoaceticus]